MIHFSSKQIKKLLGAVFVLYTLIFSFAPQVNAVSHPVQAIRAVLNRENVQAGYTLSNKKNTVSVKIAQDGISSLDGIHVFLKRLSKQQAATTPTKKKRVSPIWEYGLMHKEGVSVQKPILIKLTWRQKLKGTISVVAWDDTQKKWVSVPTVVKKKDKAAYALFKTPYARMTLIHKKKTQARPPKKKKVVQYKRIASWYHASFSAMNIVPLGTRVRVINPANGKQIETVVGSTGPFVPGRIIDLPRSAFETLGNLSQGVMDVIV